MSLLQEQVSQLTSEPIVLRLASAVTDTFVVDLSSIAISELSEALGCGVLGFRLLDDSYGDLLAVDPYGVVTLVSPVVNDEGWIGLHDVRFETYLVDWDPSGEIMS